MQSTLQFSDNMHAAIIMDGNGRWATARGRPRSAGHHAGVDAVRRVVEAAPSLGIGTLTLFAFSSDNWQRPRAEVATLMRLLRRYVDAEAARLAQNGIRLAVIGRRDRLPAGLAAAIAAAEAVTAGGERLHLRIALDYSSRDSILQAATLCPSGSAPTREEFSWLLTGQAALRGRDVDLLIRTGGEQRLSDFLLWECAYAELHFTKRMWPDFTADDLAAAVTEFRRRERRFGAAGPTPAPSQARADRAGIRAPLPAEFRSAPSPDPTRACPGRASCDAGRASPTCGGGRLGRGRRWQRQQTGHDDAMGQRPSPLE